MALIRTIVVAVDGSKNADHAFETAVELARMSSAALTILGVAPTHRDYTGTYGGVRASDPEERRWFRELLSRYSKSAREGGVSEISTEQFEGSPVDCIVTYLEGAHPDLVIMGARGLSTTRRLFLGSVSEGVLHHSTCSVLIVRSPPPKPARDPKPRRTKSPKT
ncbi:MAG TPA: universal stress protein [Thermoplasmata archaeon]|nr:universal stress protein [Thermoplasmata archaeon]